MAIENVQFMYECSPEHLLTILGYQHLVDSLPLVNCQHWCHSKFLLLPDLLAVQNPYNNNENQR